MNFFQTQILNPLIEKYAHPYLVYIIIIFAIISLIMQIIQNFDNIAKLFILFTFNNKQKKSQIAQNYSLDKNLSFELRELAQEIYEARTFQILTGIYSEKREYRNALLHFKNKLPNTINWDTIKNARFYLEFNNEGELSIKPSLKIKNISILSTVVYIMAIFLLLLFSLSVVLLLPFFMTEDFFILLTIAICTYILAIIWIVINRNILDRAKIEKELLKIENK